MKSLVFTTFFSRVAFYYFTTDKNGQIPKKKVLFLEVATTIVPIFFFFFNVTSQGHYIYTLFRSLFDPIGLKTTLLDLSTFLS